MGLEGHRAEAPVRLDFAVVTVSDTREPSTDRGGDALVEALEDAGHRLAWRTLVRDEPEEIRRALHAACGPASVVLFTGGTGIAPRDVTVPVLGALFDAPIPGFGELFRWLSFQEIGAAAMLSRAAAGRVGGTIVFALPGSPNALGLAMQRLILPEVGHLVSQARSASGGVQGSGGG